MKAWRYNPQDHVDYEYMQWNKFVQSRAVCVPLGNLLWYSGEELGAGSHVGFVNRRGRIDPEGVQ